MSDLMQHNIAFIGFGEAAQAFVKGWNVPAHVHVCAYDIKTVHDDEAVRHAKWQDYERLGVTGAASLGQALETADVVFSLVTADQAARVAAEAVGFLKKDALYLECNSCAPGTKRRNGELMTSKGVRFVDVAIMAPVYPKMHHTPLSVCGVHSEAAKTVLDALDMKVTLIEGDVGAASSIKMIRSIMMKGLEALFAECVLAGVKAGVDQQVLDSLDVTYPGFDFSEKAAYMLERSTTHGVRRAAEMREVALTIEELGLSNEMTTSTVAWQQRLGELKVDTTQVGTYQERAALVLAALEKE